MCTLGAISHEKGVYLLKAMDSFPIAYTHSFVKNMRGHSWMNFTITPQTGCNVGLNEEGLGVVISGSDPKFISDRAPGWDSVDPPVDMRDFRTIGNAIIMGECRNTDDAVSFLSEWIPAHPTMMGGNFLFADARGRIVNVEHLEGEMVVQEESKTSAHANCFSSLLSRADQARPGLEDSFPRIDKMNEFLVEAYSEMDGRGGSLSSGEAFRDRARSFLGNHEPGLNQPGSICVHGLDLPGARANSVLPLWTISGFVLDTVNRVMHFTQGNPCTSSWQTLEFAESEASTS